MRRQRSDRDFASSDSVLASLRLAGEGSEILNRKSRAAEAKRARPPREQRSGPGTRLHLEDPPCPVSSDSYWSQLLTPLW
jgi:hypothetical protein